MSLVFKTPKSTLNTTTGEGQNIGYGECPECPECPKVELSDVDVEYTENGEYTLTPEGDGFSSVGITVNIDTQAIEDAAYAEGEAAGIITGKAQGVAEQKAKLESATFVSNGTYTKEDGYNEVTVNVPSDVNNQTKEVTISSNGTEIITADSGYSGLGSVEVTVDVPEKQLTDMLETYTTNGEYTITPPTGYDGFSEVNVSVQIDEQAIYQDGFNSGLDAGIAEQKAKLTSTTFSSNSTYTSEDGWNEVTVDVQPNLGLLEVTPSTERQQFDPESVGGYDGFSQVDVDPVTSAIDSNITASNIKDGVTILGVTGTYDPQPSLESKTASYTANGTYTITPSTGYDGMDEVEVTVNVAGGSGTQCPDWSSIGWDCNDVDYVGINDDVAVTASLLENYTPSYGSHPFANTDIVYAPKVSPTNGGSPINNIVGWFQNCYHLKYVPTIVFRSGQVLNQNNCVATSMFENCISLETINIDLKDYGNGSASNGYVTGALRMFAGCTALTDVTLSNTEGLEILSQMFSNCANLTVAPMFDTSSATDVNDMFSGCKKLTEIPIYDFSNVTTMARIFNGCTALKKIPALNTSNVAVVMNWLGNSWSTLQLEEVALLNFSKATNIQGMFNNYMTLNNLTTLGGFLNLGKAFASTDVAAYHLLELQKATKLTKESIMNVINNLAAPDDTAVTDATLRLSAASYALLDAEDIAIATAKNWSVVSA